jgi:hypothetical protein
MTARAPQDDLFTLEDLDSGRTWRPVHRDGCDVCQYCTLLRQARGLRERLNPPVSAASDASFARPKEEGLRGK